MVLPVNVVHERFGVKMDDVIVDGFKTVGDMVDYIVTHYESVPWCVSPERRSRQRSRTPRRRPNRSMDHCAPAVSSRASRTGGKRGVSSLCAASAQLQWQTTQIRCQRTAGEGRNAMEPADLLDHRTASSPPAWRRCRLHLRGGRRCPASRRRYLGPAWCAVPLRPPPESCALPGQGRAGWICAGTTGWRSVFDAAVGRRWRASPQTCGRRPRKPACRCIVAVVLFSVRSGCSWPPDRKPDEMTAPVSLTSEPATSARTCPGDQIGPCSTCRLTRAWLEL